MKTIKEAAKRYSHNLIPDESGMSFPLEREAIQDAIKFGVQFAESWISVEEELPIEPSKYLVVRYGEIELCEWKSKGKDNEGYWCDYLGITHWRPINRK